MNEGRNYWLIPFLFSIIFVESGFILFSYEGFFPTIVNGSITYAFQPNYLVWYNTAHGPFSSIFMSNFLFDGWGNLFAFLVYAFVFVVAIKSLSFRVRKAWFTVIGAILSGILAGAIIRLFMPGGYITYGQSAVLAGFAGISVFYAIYAFISFLNSDSLEFGNFLVYLGVLSVGIAMLYGFVTSELSRISITVHVIALLTGVILAFVFTLMERSAGKGRRARIGASLITEEEGTGGGI